MTLLSFFHYDNGFEILTDTLATTPDNVPYQFVDKVFLYPSRRMVMAGTGSADLLSQWDRTLRDRVLALDLHQIDRFAPDTLHGLWEDMQQRPDFPDRLTATIYHFGFTHGSDQAVRAVYRSDTGFASEVHVDNAFAIKPQPTTLRIPADLDDWIAAAGELREEQAALPITEAITIGGELVLTSVAPDGLAQKIVHQYPDYGDQWNQMNEDRVSE